MAFETSAQRDIARRESDDTVNRFVQRQSTMVSEADRFLSELQAKKTILESVQTTVNAMVAADADSQALAFEKTISDAKVAEITAVITQASAIKTAIEQIGA